MLGLFTKKVKKGVGVVSLACFLCMPLTYTVSMSTAAASSLDQIQYAQRHDNDDRKWDRDDKRPPRHDRDDKWDKNDNKRPPRHDRDDKRDKDKDKDDYSKGDITTAVLIGGVIGAIIAKNT